MSSYSHDHSRAWSLQGLLCILCLLGLAACDNNQGVNYTAPANCEQDSDCEQGSDCEQDSDCAADQRCGEEGRCQEGCRADTCQGDDLVRCVQGQAQEPTACPNGCLQRGDGAACLGDQVCEPNSRGCDNAEVAWSCNEDGSRRSTALCVDGSSCANGECQPPIIECEPDSVGCLDPETAFVCDAQGAAVARPCGQGQLCQGGSCRDVVCPANTTSCDGDALVTCNAQGTASTSQPCNQTEACLDSALGCRCEQGACVERECAPGALRCQEGAAQACERGVWGDAQACGFDQACLEGACVPAQGCQAGQTLCAGDKLLACEGDAFVLRLDCADNGLLCDGAQGACAERICEPSARSCRGDVALRCDPRGSGFEDAGVDCAADGGGCFEGLCEARCRPGRVRCDGAQVLTCRPDGLGEDAQACAPGLICAQGVCGEPVCEPGQALCAGARATTCAEDGSGGLPGGEDCAAQGMRCREGACIGGDNLCPVTIARGGAQGVPLRQRDVVIEASQTLILDGTASLDDDSVSRVAWVQVEGPPGATLAPDTDPRRSLVTGLHPLERYVFEATAYDSARVPACEPARLEVYTVDSDAWVFHVLWHNPADPDEQDNEGADVDAHLLQASDGFWFEQPQDLHFNNAEVTWDGATSALVLDDTNGRGPEVIRLSQAADCQWYVLGLHLFRQQLGDSFVTVDVFRDGALVWSQVDLVMDLTDQWVTALAVHGGSGELFPILEDQPSAPREQRPLLSQEAAESGLCGFPEDVEVLPTCQPDALGDLRDPADAAPLEQGPYEGLTLCPDERDHFTAQVEPGQAWFVRFRPDRALSVGALVTHQGERLLEELLPGVNAIPVAQPGEHLLRLRWLRGAGISYDLSSWTCPARPSGQETQEGAPEALPGLHEGELCSHGHYRRVELRPGDTLRARVGQGDPHRDYRLRLRLLDAQGQTLAGGITEGDALTTVEATVEAQAVVYVQVEPLLPVQTRYSLELEVLPAPDSPDLAVLDAQLGPLLAGQPYEGSLTLQNRASVQAPASTVHLYLGQEGALGDSPTLLGTAQAPALAARQRAEVPFSLPGFFAPEEGPLWLCMQADADQALDEEDEEDNTLCRQVTVDRDCQDALTPSSQEQPVTLEPGDYEALRACQDPRRDWYRVCAGPEDQIQVHLLFNRALAPLRATLYNERGEPLGNAGPAEEGLLLDVEATGEEACYLFSVWYSSGDPDELLSALYGMSVSVAPLPPEQRCAPGGEPNNSLSDSAPLAPLLEAQAPLDRCPAGDVDFYSFSVSEQAEAFTLCVVPGEEVPSTNIVLSVYDDQQQQLGAQSNPQPCLTQEVVPGAAQYFMRVLVPSRELRKLPYQITLEEQTPEP